jgi:diguanylate cyclase (GGDEF)-like protein
VSRQSDQDLSRDGSSVPDDGQGDGAGADRSSSDADQVASDSDQTTSDTDQTASDADQTASDRDQLQAEADQRSADRDQLAADRDLSAHQSDAVTLRAYRDSRGAREQSALERQATALTRAQISSERDRQAIHREEEAQRRDSVALDRDRAAEVRDGALVELAGGLKLPRDAHLRLAIEAAAELRAHAAADRARAAGDRERAAADREHAARDRRELYAALEQAHLDDLTGAYRRGMGEIVLRNEVERAQRSKIALTLAVVDADNLKAVNDARGHGAGDSLLQDLAAAIREKLRPYDPLVRTGGDEFVCTITETKLEGAQRRFDGISASLAATQQGASISVGLVEMNPRDTLPTLIERGDIALYEAKREK